MFNNYFRMDYGGMNQDPSAGQQQQIMQQVAQALQQGANPEQVMQQLVQMGIPQQQAVQVIQAVMQQMQGSQPQAPGMGYGGGLPYAAEGMSFGTGSILTLPNVASFPSYSAYNQAYNTYLSSIDTTTTQAPAGGDVIDYSKYANDSIYNNAAVDTFAQRINSGLIGKDDTLNTITPDRTNNGVGGRNPIRPEQQVMDLINAEANKDKEGYSPWTFAALGALGLGVGAAGIYKGKKIYDRRWGQVAEKDYANASPEKKAMMDRNIQRVKEKIDKRGYTVGNRDVNDLVTQGMSRKDAQEYVDALPDKSGRSKRSSTRQDDTAGNTSSSNTTSADDGGYTEPEYDFSDVNDIEDLVDYEYHRQRLQEDLDKGYDGSYHTKQLNKDPRTYLEEDIVYSSQKLEENLGTPNEKYYRDKIAESKAKLKRLNEIAPDAVAPGVGSVRGSATVTSSTGTEGAGSAGAGQTGEPSQTSTSESGTEGSSEETSTGTTEGSTSQKKETKVAAPKTPTQKPTTEQVTKTKERIKLQQQVKSGKLTTAELIQQAKDRGLEISGPGRTYRGVRPNPDKDIDISNYGRKRSQIREKRKQEVEKKIEKGEFKLAMGGYVPEYAAQAYGAYDLPQFEMGSYYAQGGNYPWNGTWNGNQGFAYGGHNPFEENPLRRFVYADGGMSPEEAMMMQQQQGAAPQEGGGEDQQMRQIVEAVVNLLEQGIEPDRVLEELVKAGVPQEIAEQVIQHVLEQQQGGGMMQQPDAGQQMPPEAMMQQGPGPDQGGEEQMPTQRYGGGLMAYGGQPRVGDVMDVTPAQLEKLRKQGIRFEII